MLPLSPESQVIYHQELDWMGLLHRLTAAHLPLPLVTTWLWTELPGAILGIWGGFGRIWWNLGLLRLELRAYPA